LGLVEVQLVDWGKLEDIQAKLSFLKGNQWKWTLEAQCYLAPRVKWYLLRCLLEEQIMYLKALYDNRAHHKRHWPACRVPLNLRSCHCYHSRPLKMTNSQDGVVVLTRNCHKPRTLNAVYPWVASNPIRLPTLHHVQQHHSSLQTLKILTESIF